MPDVIMRRNAVTTYVGIVTMTIVIFACSAMTANHDRAHSDKRVNDRL